MEINFVLICDGSSDLGLGNHVQALLLQNGATQVNWTGSYQGRRLQEKIRFGLRQANHPDMLFVHRDAEVAEPDLRYEEIRSAIDLVEFHGASVGIVPRRMTEAWLLLDESAIREVVGRPRGGGPLHLPSSRVVESLPDPKDQLREALLAALAPRGRRRRKKFDSDWAIYRDRLLENLPVVGPLERVPSWARFRDDTVAALRELSG